MKRMLLGTFAAIVVATALTVPASASADAGPGCRVGEGVVECAKRLLRENGPVVTQPCEGEPLTACVYRLLRDLCYSCDPEPLVRAILEEVNETCERLLPNCEVS